MINTKKPLHSALLLLQDTKRQTKSYKLKSQNTFRGQAMQFCLPTIFSERKRNKGFAAVDFKSYFENRNM